MLHICLGNQANLLVRLKRFDSAKEKFQELEGICRELNAPHDLAAMLNNYAMMLADDLHDPAQALPLVEEAYAIARRHGLQQTAQGILPSLNHIRNAVS